MQPNNGYMLGGPGMGTGNAMSGNRIMMIGGMNPQHAPITMNMQYANTIPEATKKSNFTVQRANTAVLSNDGVVPAMVGGPPHMAPSAGHTHNQGSFNTLSSSRLPASQLISGSSLLFSQPSSAPAAIPSLGVRAASSAPLSTAAPPSPPALPISLPRSAGAAVAQEGGGGRFLPRPLLTNSSRGFSGEDNSAANNSMMASTSSLLKPQTILSGRGTIYNSSNNIKSAADNSNTAQYTPRPTFLHDKKSNVNINHYNSWSASGNRSPRRPQRNDGGAPVVQVASPDFTSATECKNVMRGGSTYTGEDGRSEAITTNAAQVASTAAAADLSVSSLHIVSDGMQTTSSFARPSATIAVSTTNTTASNYANQENIHSTTAAVPQYASATQASGSSSATKKGQGRFFDMKVCKGRFIVKTQIGAGSFGELFWGTDTWSDKEVAIKLEPCKVRQPQLLFESRLYKLLHNRASGFHPSITRCYPEELAASGNQITAMDEDRGGGVSEYSGGGAEDSSPARTRNKTGAGGRYPRYGNNGVAATFRELMEVVGFPNCHYYGVEGDYNVMVMDLLGPNLEDLFNYCSRQFTVKTVCLLADQMLHRIEYLHHKGFIHRDLKPENFTMGGDRDKGHILYLIDFGLSKRYWDPRVNQHISYKEGKSLTGTARYCSVNAHLGIEQSRRDDLESLGYILLYFLKKGFLPWQGIRGATDPQTKNVRISEKKISTSLEVLCRDEPPQIFRYMKYVRELKFEETPDYRACREFFAQLLERQHEERDWIFDWVVRREMERKVEQHQHLQVQVMGQALRASGETLSPRR